MIRWSWKGVAVIFVLVLCVIPALAQQPGQVVVGGQLVAKLRVSVGGLSSQQRAQAVDARIVEALSYVYPAEDQLTIRRFAPRTLSVCAGKCPVMTVTRKDARANGDTIRQLARIWRQKLLAGLIIASPRMKTK
jgi:hypothetical protein